MTTLSHIRMFLHEDKAGQHHQDGQAGQGHGEATECGVFRQVYIVFLATQVQRLYYSQQYIILSNSSLSLRQKVDFDLPMSHSFVTIMSLWWK